MNKFKKYLKENYKRILLIILIIVGYIGLLFACKYANQEIKENITSINVLHKQLNRNSRNNTQLYSMEDNNIYWSTENLNNIFSFEDYDILEYNSYAEYGYLEEIVIDETYLDYGNGNYICFNFTYESLNYQENNTEDNFGLGLLITPTNNFTINIDPSKYYYVYSDFYLCATGYLNDSWVEYYRVNNFTLSTDYNTLYEYEGYNCPIIKGDFLLNCLDYLYIDLTMTLTNRSELSSFYLYVYLSVYDLSDFTDFNLNNGYNEGYNNGFDDGFDNGYEEGVNFKTFGGLNYLDYIQYAIDEDGIEFDKEYLIENNYLSNGSLYLSKLGEELGLSYSPSRIYLYFNDLPSSYLNLLFNVFGNDNDYINVVVSSNYGEVQYSFDSYVNDKLILTPDLFGNSFYIDDIIISYQNLETVGTIINLNNGYNEGYNNGYNEGYNNGLFNGENFGVNKVLDNLGNYELYDKNEYLDYGETQKQIGINIGKTSGCSVNNLFFAIADIPTRILSSLLSFELFGINMFIAFGSIATLLLIIWVIRKVK